MRRYHTIGLHLAIIIAFVMMAGCAATIATYDSDSIERTVEVRVKTLLLMDKAIHPYDQYEKEVDEIMENLWVARELAAIRPDNTETVQQWDLMLNPDTGIISTFFSAWKRDGQRSQTMILNKKRNVTQGFDLILNLEKQKLRWE